MAQANGLYVNAQAISGDTGSVSGTTVGEPNFESGDNAFRMVWYKWTATATGAMQFDTLATTADTYIQVYEHNGTRAASTLVISNDNTTGSTASKVKFRVTAGKEYRLGIGTPNFGVDVSFTLSWQTAIIPPAPSNDFYNNAIDISSEENGSIAGTWKGASSRNYANSGYHDVWYKYRPQVPGRLRLTLTTTDPDAGWWVEMWRGAQTSDDYHTSVYIDARGEEDVTTYSVTVRYDVSTDIVSYINVISGPNGIESDFTLEWFLEIPVADPVTGMKNETISVDYRVLSMILHNPLLNEVWVCLSTDDGLYSDGLRSEVIARVRDADGVFIDYINYEGDTHRWGFTEPFFYDAYNKLVWACYGSQITNDFTRMAIFDATTAEFVRDFEIGYSPSPWSKVNPYTGNFLNWQGNYVKTYTPEGVLLSTVFMEGAIGGVWLPQYVPDGTVWLFTAMGWPYPNEFAQYDLQTGQRLQTFDFDNMQGHLHSETGWENSPDKRFMQRIVYDPDRNSIWINREGNFADEPKAILYEFSLDTNSIVAEYPMMEMLKQINLYNNFVYDPYHKAIVGLSYQQGSNLTEYSTATGEILSTQEAGYIYDILYYPTPTPYAVYIGGGDGYFYRVGIPTPKFEIPIINDRDVWLQTFVGDARFEKVTAMPGTVTSGAQTGGTSIAIAAAKRLSLSAPVQYFIVRDGPQ